MFGVTNTVKNNNKENYVHCDYGIAFDGKGECSFGNDFARNVIILGLIIVHHLIPKMIFQFYLKEILLVLIDALVHQKKKLILILVKQRQNFAWVCIITVMIVIYL